MKVPIDINAIVKILVENTDCRKDNRKLIKEYYRQIYDMSLDEAFECNEVPNYQTIERYGRLAKAQYEKLRVDKSDKVAEYKDIAREVILIGEQKDVHNEDS